jgi:hypothetical protein
MSKRKTPTKQILPVDLRTLFAEVLKLRKEVADEEARRSAGPFRFKRSNLSCVRTDPNDRDKS